jgi:ubiquinone/menaquinone biosynthesis C-methylase UbiE
MSLPGGKYIKFLAFLKDVRSAISVKDKVLLYLPPAKELGSMRAEVLTASLQNVIDDCYSGGTLDLRRASGLAYKIYRGQATPAVVQTPLPLLTQAPSPDVERLIDFIAAERTQFERIATKADASVPKIFRSIGHGTNKLPFLNVIIHQPGEISDSVWAPILKNVIEDNKAIYDVDIDDPPSFERAGLVADTAFIRSERERFKGPGRMLFIPLVRAADKVVEAVAQISNLVPISDPRETPLLLSAIPQSAERIKTELVNYFQAAVFAIETARNRKSGRGEATPPPQPGQSDWSGSTGVKITHKDLAALPEVRIGGRWRLLFSFIIQRIRLLFGFRPREAAKLVDFFNQRTGRRIRAYLDYPENVADPRKAPWVIIPPAYSKTKETMFLQALQLKMNGFGVLRYDDTCSVGESDGEMRDQTLSESASNIIAAVEYLSITIRPEQIGLGPVSLSARVSIKAAGQDSRIKFMLPLMGVPNIQSILKKVCGEDLVAGYLSGRKNGPMNILGYTVDGTNFINDASRAGFLDLASTLKDMESVKIPIIWVCGDQDAWIDIEEVKQVLNVNPFGAYRDVKIIDGLSHRLRESGKAPEVFAEVVRLMKFLTTGEEMLHEQLALPEPKVIVAKAVRERSRVKTTVTRQEEIDGWTKYLKGYDILLQLPEYREYLERIWKLLEIQPGERLLDVGTGNANLLALGVEKMATTEKVAGWNDCKLVGVDFVQEALDRASQKLERAKAIKSGLPSVEFQRVDIEAGELPHGDAFYDKIVASLFLSYLQEPGQAVKKMCAKLKKGGTIVLTSLKPGADVSQMYAQFMAKLEASTASDREEMLQRGRDMLNSVMGWIEAQEESGQYEYLSAEKMADMLEANEVEIVLEESAFGDQAAVVVGRKKGKQKKN